MKKFVSLEKSAFFILLVYALLTTYAAVNVLLDRPYIPILTPLNSLLAFTFAILHSFKRLGWKQALLLLGITFTISLAFESVGVATGFIYGKYHYTHELGFKFLGLVPLLIPVAWFMMSYPSFIMAMRLIPSIWNLRVWRFCLAAVSAAIMTAWDLAMDPVMVASGHWIWDQPGAYFNIPIQNFWGWWLTILIAILLFLKLGRVTPASHTASDVDNERFAILSYIITGFGTIVVGFKVGLAGPALVGLFAMVPWVFMAWFARHDIQPDAS